MEKALVSIIVPIYNAEQYLSACIDSVLALKSSRWQLILVNDGSEDISSDICKKYCEEDSRILYLEQKNSGVSAARNYGMLYAVGEWTAFLDADDMLLPNALDVLSLADNDIDMIVTGYTRRMEGFVFSQECQHVSGIELQQSILNLREFKRKRRDVTAIDAYNRWSCWGRFYRTEKIQKFHIEFPLGIKLSEDLVFCMSYAKSCNQILINNSITYFYRRNAVSVTQQFHLDRVENMIQMIECVIPFVERETLDKDLTVFIMDNITKCCVEYYADTRNGLGKRDAAVKLKELCERRIFQNAISKCRYLYLIRGIIGKRNQIYNCLVICFLRRHWYSKLIDCMRKLRKYC